MTPDPYKFAPDGSHCPAEMYWPARAEWFDTEDDFRRFVHEFKAELTKAGATFIRYGHQYVRPKAFDDFAYFIHMNKGSRGTPWRLAR